MRRSARRSGGCRELRPALVPRPLSSAGAERNLRSGALTGRGHLPLGPAPPPHGSLRFPLAPRVCLHLREREVAWGLLTEQCGVTAPGGSSALGKQSADWGGSLPRSHSAPVCRLDLHPRGAGPSSNICLAAGHNLGLCPGAGWTAASLASPGRLVLHRAVGRGTLDSPTRPPSTALSILLLTLNRAVRP